MRVCDYIANSLAKRGVKYVFGLVGGGTAGLNDGFFKHPDLEFVCFHHEQGAGHAAVAAARTTKSLSVVNVTTGCGGTNVVTSCLNAWQESVPVLFISGNANQFATSQYLNETRKLSLRKYGLQEHNIIETVKSITKYSIYITSLTDFVYEFEKALSIAEDGRPGPVWIDIPSNLQTAELPLYTGLPYEKYLDRNLLKYSVVDHLFNLMLKLAKRPVIIAGQGISISKAGELFREYVDKTEIPFVTTFLTRDLIEYDHPQNLGLIGIKGNRAANFAVQNSDFLIILGCSLNVSHIGYSVDSFSPYSKKVLVDIDDSELRKDTVKIDLKVRMSAFEFLTIKSDYKTPEFWSNKVSSWKSKWPIYNPDIHRSDVGGINLYELVESFNRNMTENVAVMVDAGQPCYICSTNLKLKRGQRYMAQAAQGDMGYAIPACVGVYKSDPLLNIILCIGEGSFFTNVQELAVIKQHNIPVKIFVVNNGGYMSIKQTQDKFFGGNRYGVDSSTGVNFPDIKEISTAFGLAYKKIETNEQLDSIVPNVLDYNFPCVIEVMSQHTLDVLPAQAIKPDGTQGGLHDMAPFLSKEELESEMVVKI